MASSSSPAEEDYELMYGSESGWVDARTSCQHLDSLSPDLRHIPAPHTPCHGCQHPTENWLCLSCKEVLCSRFVNKHMLQHFRDTNNTHCVALSFSDLSVWCFSCDAYLDAQLIPQLRPVHQVAYILKFGALGSSPSEWEDGYFAQVGMLIGGSWLKLWIQAAAAMSNLGLFEAEMTSDAFQLQGMSKIGMLPALFASRSKYGTPTVSILFSATGVIFLSWLSFQEIIEFLNFLYAIGMLLEFAAFITLRLKNPNLFRPYRVPLGTFWATMLCLPPALLLILVMCLASLRTFFVSGAVILVGFILYPILVQAKDKNWILFEAELPSLNSSSWQQCHSVISEMTDQENKGVELVMSSPLASVDEELSLLQSDSKQS